MRKISFILLVLFVCTIAQAQNYWTQLDSIKGPPKSVASAFVLNGEGFVLCGMESTGFTRKMFSYDIGQDDWDSAQALGGINGSGLSRGSASAFTIYNKGYICLGQGDNTNYLDDVWEYDPALDVWSQKADFGGSARRAAVSFVIGGFAYVGTGQDENGLRADFYKYSPISNSWSVCAMFPGTPRKYAVGFAMGNQGYVGTGDDGVLRNDFWQYDAGMNSWMPKANFPGTVRAGAIGWGIFPQGFIATGEDNTFTYCSDVWEYNYFTNQWIQRASIPGGGRKHAIAFTIGNIAYVGAGYNGSLLDDFYSYTGITGISDLAVSDAPVAYPNPAIGSFTLTSAHIDWSACALIFSDAAGRDMSSSFTTITTQNQVEVRNLSAPPGLYHVTIVGKNSHILSTAPVILKEN